jgi:hypothetical protein
MTRMSRSARLEPPYVAPWSDGRTWGFATVGGILAGIFTGAIFRRRRADRNQSRAEAHDGPA